MRLLLVNRVSRQRGRDTNGRHTNGYRYSAQAPDEGGELVQHGGLLSIGRRFRFANASWLRARSRDIEANPEIAQGLYLTLGARCAWVSRHFTWPKPERVEPRLQHPRSPNRGNDTAAPCYSAQAHPRKCRIPCSARNRAAACENARFRIRGERGESSGPRKQMLRSADFERGSSLNDRGCKGRYGGSRGLDRPDMRLWAGLIAVPRASRRQKGEAD